MKKLQPKILMVNTNSMKFDGITMTILNYVSNIDKSNIQIDFLAINTVEEKLRSQIERMGCKIHEIKNRNSNPLKYVLSLAKLIRKERYHIVHIHCNSRTATFDLLGAYLGGAKIRAPHSHNTKCSHTKLHQLARPVFNLLYTDAFACGKEAGEWLFSRREFKILRNATDIEKYKFSPESRDIYRTKFNLENRIAIGHVAHFTLQKNHQFLIDAFRDVVKINPNYILFLIGDGRYRKDIENKVKHYGLEQNVVFTGTILDIPQMLSAMDFMVLPSLYEGLPNVVIEWQAAGLPSLVADTVTKGCQLTDLVTFIPLVKEDWIDAILSMGELRDRKDYSQEIKNAGFNIVENANELKLYYLNRLHFLC